MQQRLDRKRLEVDGLKMELQLKHEQTTQVGSLLAKQECDEMVNSYLDAAEYDALEKHKNDHLKTRLQLEMIDCQIQLTRALLNKKDVESKVDALKRGLDMSENIYQEAQDLCQKSTSAAATCTNSFLPQASDHSKSLVQVGSDFSISSSSTALAANKIQPDNTPTPHESLNQDMHTTTRTHYCNMLITSSTRRSGKCTQSRATSNTRKRTLSCQCGHKLSPVEENKKND